MVDGQINNKFMVEAKVICLGVNWYLADSQLRILGIFPNSMNFTEI